MAITFICGLILGCIVIGLILGPKVKKTEKLNQEIILRNRDQLFENKKLESEKEILLFQIERCQEQLNITQLNIEELKQKSAEAANAVYEANIKVAEQQLETQTEKLGKQYQEYEQECKQHYLALLENECNLYNQEIQIKEAEAQKIRNELLILQTSLFAAIEANKKIQAEENQLEYYRLQLSDEDLVEIKQLKDVAIHLRNSEPLYKIIWKTYYEKPYNDLISRLSLDKNLIGIYKITNIKTKTCYIGQSVNIKDRFREHIKAGLGIGGSNNKLYSAMKKQGVENFIFEVLETCPRGSLNEREKYWIAFYRSDIEGYNMTKGNSGGSNV